MLHVHLRREWSTYIWDRLQDFMLVCLQHEHGLRSYTRSLCRNSVLGNTVGTAIADWCCCLGNRVLYLVINFYVHVNSKCPAMPSNAQHAKRVGALPSNQERRRSCAALNLLCLASLTRIINNIINKAVFERRMESDN